MVEGSIEDTLPNSPQIWRYQFWRFRDGWNKPNGNKKPPADLYKNFYELLPEEAWAKNAAAAKA